MHHKEISTFHVVLLFTMVTGLLNHVIILPPLLDAAGRDAWISILFTYVLYLGWALLLYYIIRVTKQESLIKWLQKRMGKPITYILMAGIVLYLIISVTITLKDMVLWTHVTYLPYTPPIITTLSFLSLCLLLANTSLRTIAIVNGILLPIVIILGFFVASANMSKKDYALLTPLFEYGLTPSLLGMIYVGAGLIEVSTILYFQHRVKTRINYLSLFIIGSILIWLTLGPTMGAIATFGPDKASELRFPAYEQWALLSLGRYVEHVDFFSIYQWLSGAFLRITIGLYLIAEVLQLAPGKAKRIVLATIALFILALNLIPISDIRFVHLLAKLFLPWKFFYTFILVILIAVLVFIGKRRANHHEVS